MKLALYLHAVVVRLTVVVVDHEKPELHLVFNGYVSGVPGCLYVTRDATRVAHEIVPWSAPGCVDCNLGVYRSSRALSTTNEHTQIARRMYALSVAR